ncbi:hypothetical protein BUALT_Bualt02G0157100 [Buddleja alternifolia]|uniref:Recombination activating protein 1 n=1 Tax=Buddleja alternifolia TaxID=168488 RepID=A0AAV6Y7L9_9LAMI|nr:hypothetical protein BUALT_Bualt02G0157100 [Buddleja alternifolia]
MDEKRAKGLCFYCDEKFNKEHVCSKRRQLYIMEMSDQCEEEELEQSHQEEGIEGSQDEESTHDEQLINHHVSMNAMTGVHDFRTMRVNGCKKVGIKVGFPYTISSSIGKWK